MLVELILLVASIVAPRYSVLEFLTKGIRETKLPDQVKGRLLIPFLTKDMSMDDLDKVFGKECIRSGISHGPLCAILWYHDFCVEVHLGPLGKGVISVKSFGGVLPENANLAGEGK